jgi:hypothetical protein
MENHYHQNEISQLQTRIAILESQLELKTSLINHQKQEIKRLVNLVGAIHKKSKGVPTNDLVINGDYSELRCITPSST